MALPRLSTLFPRSDARSLYFGPGIPGGLLPETAQALAREALESKDEHGAIARLARKYQVKRYVVRAAAQRPAKPVRCSGLLGAAREDLMDFKVDVPRLRSDAPLPE